MGTYTLLASLKQIPSRLSCLRWATESCKGCHTEAATSMINSVFWFRHLCLAVWPPPPTANSRVLIMVQFEAGTNNNLGDYPPVYGWEELKWYHEGQEEQRVTWREGFIWVGNLWILPYTTVNSVQMPLSWFMDADPIIKITATSYLLVRKRSSKIIATGPFACIVHPSII